jgi:hypothetical protein
VPSPAPPAGTKTGTDAVRPVDAGEADPWQVTNPKPDGELAVIM